ncbi:MAG: hypothetical protein K0R92_666 [Lachnospiraceae bacterium]|jgi:hypothetical protein|nr:hypothetical protein [Lachnospiraceae bacterium]
MVTDELSMLYTHISSSIDFTIPTIAILDLAKIVDTWITDGDCGAIIFGRPRIGKTRAIHYISKELKKKYGKDLPVYVLNTTDHKPSEKYFYSELLKTIGHNEAHKGTASMMKERLINALISDSRETQYRRVVLFIDEAFLLTEKDFIWLMDIHNNLDMCNVHLTVLMFGTNELKGIKNAYCRARRFQIVDRFMVEEYEYKGIASARDALACLHNMDIPLSNYPGNIILTQIFFPDAYADKKRLAACANAIWDAFLDLIQGNNIPDIDIPMKYFMKAVVYCLKTYGVHGKGIYFPDKSAWKDAVNNSGYLKSVECIGM